jgi:hypothetical protein
VEYTVNSVSAAAKRRSREKIGQAAVRRQRFPAGLFEQRSNPANSERLIQYTAAAVSCEIKVFTVSANNCQQQQSNFVDLSKTFSSTKVCIAEF